MSAAVTSTGSEATLFSRILRPEKDDLSPEAARSLLKLDFDASDRARMRELAAKGRSGKLSDAEDGELESYCRVGHLLDLLHSKARLSLKKTERTLR
jgi:hypothetical protein